MMGTLFLQPHSDDGTLFAAWTILRYRPHVVTCFESHVQAQRGGPDHATRLWEDKMALFQLGIRDFTQLPVRDDGPDEQMLVACLEEFKEQEWERVFAPAVELGGHAQHNMVGDVAAQLWEDVTFYTTYVRGQGRTRTDHEVSYEDDWPAAKFRAMACYVSQINTENCRPWFSDWDREWYE